MLLPRAASLPPWPPWAYFLLPVGWGAGPARGSPLVFCFLFFNTPARPPTPRLLGPPLTERSKRDGLSPTTLSSQLSLSVYVSAYCVVPSPIFAVNTAQRPASWLVAEQEGPLLGARGRFASPPRPLPSAPDITPLALPLNRSTLPAFPAALGLRPTVAPVSCESRGGGVGTRSLKGATRRGWVPSLTATVAGRATTEHEAAGDGASVSILEAAAPEGLRISSSLAS